MPTFEARRIVDNQQATFTAAGVATVRFRPVPYGRRWRIYRSDITTTSALRTAATVYRNNVGRADRLDVTPYQGNDNTTDSVYELLGGERLVIQWTGGTPGALASGTIEGEES